MRRAREPITRFITLRWVPLTASFVSLALSVVAIIASTQQPQVMLVLPGQVRIAQGRATGAAYLYLQPAFVNTGQSERVEVIRGMRLHVQPLDAGVEPADLQWTEQVRLVGDATSNGLSYEHDADAVPLLVTPRDVAAPLSVFVAPSGWFFAPGTYTFTLTAERVVVSEPVMGSFQVVISADDIALLDQPGPDKFLELAVHDGVAELVDQECLMAAWSAQAGRPAGRRRSRPPLRLPSPMARMTVAAPRTMSPPAKTPGHGRSCPRHRSSM